MPVVYVSHVESFCAAHRLHNPDMSDEENRIQFGKCNHINAHGHNYRVEVTVKGELDPKLGYAMNIYDLKKYMLDVIDKLDHKRLDVDIEFFVKNNVNTSCENLSIYLWNEIGKNLPSTVTMHNVRVHETDKNYSDYMG